MPTLNREQLNKILELMLENQASNPGSMLVVDSDKNEILEGRQVLGETTEALTRKRNDVDFGGRKARKKVEDRKFIIDEGATVGSDITVNPHEKLLRANVLNKMLMERQSKDLESKIAQDHPKEITAIKSQLIANMVEDTRKAAAKKLGLNEAEMKGMQMVFDMNTKNIIVINPYNGADARCFDVSSTLDTIDKSVTDMFESAKNEELDALSKSIEVVEKENDAITQLDSDINGAMNEYEQQLAAYKKQSASNFESIKKAMLGDNVAPETVDERMKALKKDMEKFDKTANLERYVALQREKQRYESEVAAEEAMKGTQAVLERIENQDTALIFSAINVGNAALLKGLEKQGEGFNDLLVNLKDQKVIDKAKADLAKAQKEYKSYLNRIGELVDKRLAKVKELKEKQSKQMDNLVKEAEKAQDAAYKARITELKGSYLPAWLFGTTGLEKEIISTMDDQSKAIATAQLVSVDVSSDPDQPQQDGIELISMNPALKKETEILAEKMRLRGLRASIEATLKARSVEASLEANSVAGYDGERMEEGFDPNAFRSVDPDDPRLRASDSSVISEVSEIDHDDTVRYLKDKEQQLEGARRVLNTATNTLAEAQKGLLSVQAVLTTLEENRSHAQVKKVLYEELLEHAKGARTEVAGMDIVKNTVNGMEGLDQDQKKAMIQELEAQAGDFDPTAVKAYFAAAVRSVSSYVGGTTNEAANKGFTVKNLQDLIKGIEKTIGDLNLEVERRQAIKQSLEEDIGTAKSQVAQATLDVQSRENEVSLVKQRQEEHGYSYSPSTSSASNDDNTSLISGNSGYDSDSNEVRLDNTFETFSVFGSGVSRIESPIRGLPSSEEVMTILDKNAEQSLLARKKLALLAKLKVMSPAMTDENGKLTISDDYVEKLEKLEALYSGPTLTAEGLKAHDDDEFLRTSLGSLTDSDGSSVISSGSEASTEAGAVEDRVDATFPTDESLDGPTPQDLVARYNLCFENLQQEIKDNPYLGAALTGEIRGELVADNLQTVAKQASAITEAEVAKASISRKDAQQITDAAMAELLEKASEVGINLTALTRNNGDNELFNKLKDATLKWPKVDDMGNNILKKDENGNPIPVKDSEGNVIYDDSGEPQFEYEEEEVRIFPEGVVGLVEKGELDFISLDRRYWSNVSTQALNAGIDLLNGLIKMVNYVLSVLRIQIGEWAKYTLPYQEITAAQLANVFAFKLEESSLIKKGVNVEVFSFLNDKAFMLSRMQSALAEPEDKEFVTRFSNAIRDNFDRIKTPEYGVIEASKKAMYRDVLFGKGTGKERYKGLMESVSIYAENSRRASEYERLRKTLENTRGTKDTKESIKAGDLDRLNNTEGLVRGILRSVPLSSGTTLDSEFTVDADADANTIIAAARKLVTSNTTDGKIGRTDVDPASVMKQLDGIQMVADNTAVLNHSKEEEEIKTAKKNIVKTLTEMVIITNESTEADCLKEIKVALEEIKVSLDEKLGALPEAVSDALKEKSIDARVKERLGGMWLIFPLKYFFTKNQMRDKVIQEVLAEANDGKEKSAQAVKEVLQLQSMQEDLIGIQQEIMRNNDLMRASTKASVDNKDLHEDVQALYRQALETFPDADFDPSSLESEYKGKKMTVNNVDKDKKYISMPTRMIPVFVKALQEANLDGAYKAAQQAVTDAESAVASQKQTITGLEEKLDEAQKELDAAQQEHKDFSGEKVMKIQEDIVAPSLQNDAQNPQPTPEWLAVMDRLKAAQEAAKVADDNVASEQTKLTGLVDVATKAETKLAKDFNKDKIEAYQSALTAMSSGLDKRTQDAVKGFKQHKERKDTITTRVKKAGDLMKKLQSSPKPSTPSVSPSDSSGDHELGLDDNNPNSPGK